MESEIIVRKNMTLTNEKVKNMCRLNYEDNDFLFTTHDGKCVIIDKSKLIIHIEGDDDSNIQEYQKYLQNIMRKRKNKIILTTLSPDTHRTSEENLGLAYLTAVLRKRGYNVEIIDGWLGGLSDEEVLRRILNDKEVAIVGVSCYMSNNDKSIELAKRIREVRPEIKLMCGGFGPSFNPQKFVKDGVFDIAMIGEGEESIVEVSDYFTENSNRKIEDIKGIVFEKDGKTVRTEKRDLISDLDVIPFPARDTMNMAKDRKSTVNILTARGCMGNCLFCSVNAFNKLSNGRKWRGRSVDSIVDELEQLQNMGVKYIKVIDDSFLEQERNEQWAKEFCEKIKSRGINVSLRGSLKADQVEDEKIIDIIAKEVKTKKDALKDFEKAERQDLIDLTNREIEILQEYLPKQLSRDEVKVEVQKIISEIGATSMKDMGAIMKEAKAKMGASAEGKTINEVAKEILKL